MDAATEARIRSLEEEITLLRRARDLWRNKCCDNARIRSQTIRSTLDYLKKNYCWFGSMLKDTDWNHLLDEIGVAAQEDLARKKGAR